LCVEELPEHVASDWPIKTFIVPVSSGHSGL